MAVLIMTTNVSHFTSLLSSLISLGCKHDKVLFFLTDAPLCQVEPSGQLRNRLPQYPLASLSSLGLLLLIERISVMCLNSDLLVSRLQSLILCKALTRPPSLRRSCCLEDGGHTFPSLVFFLVSWVGRGEGKWQSSSTCWVREGGVLSVDFSLWFCCFSGPQPQAVAISSPR